MKDYNFDESILEDVNFGDLYHYCHLYKVADEMYESMMDYARIMARRHMLHDSDFSLVQLVVSIALMNKFRDSVKCEPNSILAYAFEELEVVDIIHQLYSEIEHEDFEEENILPFE